MLLLKHSHSQVKLHLEDLNSNSLNQGVKGGQIFAPLNCIHILLHYLSTNYLTTYQPYTQIPRNPKGCTNTHRPLSDAMRRRRLNDDDAMRHSQRSMRCKPHGFTP